jgi:hypothetical protein
MRGVMPRAHSLPAVAATNSRMSRIRTQGPSLRSSPAHPWRAPVRQTLKSHSSCQRWVACCRFPELPLAVSGCLVPATTFVHVPVIGCLMLVLSERRARSVLHAGLKPNVESGDLIATTECFDVTPAVGQCQVRGGPRVKGVRGGPRRRGPRCQDSENAEPTCA